MANKQGGWAPHPAASHTPAVLLLEAFGRFAASDERAHVPRGESALWSVFRSRAEMMGWERGSASGGALWSTHEVELTAGAGASRLARAQVSLEAGASVSAVLPPLAQCLDDALGRFGVFELYALQLTARQLEPTHPRSQATLASSLGWFSGSAPSSVEAVLALDDRVLRGHDESDLLGRLARMGGPFFDFGPPVSLALDQGIEVPPGPLFAGTLAASARGIAVHLPEWSPAAAAWAMACVIEEARRDEPPAPGFVVRLTRLP